MDREKRDRPATNPGGMICDQCGNVFIGEEWHMFCAICVQEIADDIAAKQGTFVRNADDQ